MAQLGAHVDVIRNDQITIEGIKELNPDRIMISPGPGYPRDAGISCDVIREFAGKVPIAGVCLGMDTSSFLYSLLARRRSWVALWTPMR
jgi:anthranilate/para-aminobenzoate synthase component II